MAMVVEECYRRKAKKVVVDWNYQPLTRLHVRHQSLTTMSTLDNYEEARWQHYVDTIPCRIYLESDDPDGLRGVNQEKMAKAQQKNIRSSRATATRSRTNTSGASRPSPA
ncbi:aminopeptidase PepS [human gut metagenome]|uniref:Aminopeptidase PepS n=1 Tax=human gut metagenome TaxID=408170 RepID=K1TI38_9ZZZZ